MSIFLNGVIHGKTIELDQAPDLPDGEAVRVTVISSARPIPPTSAEALDALKRAAGGFADDPEGLDRYLEWNRQQRKGSRREIPD
jgi:hypothetical protein